MPTADSSQDEDDVEQTQVLTFTLGEETYCLAIEYVAEIVDGGEMTTLPDTAAHVEGVMNLRGRTTTIVNPSEILGADTRELVTDGGRSDHRLIVLDTDAVDTDSPVGWLVSTVNEVKTVSNEVVDAEAVDENGLLTGLISEDGGFTIWLDPQEFLA